MTLDAFIPLPPAAFETTTEYRLSPRPKRSFHTILDPNRLLTPTSKGTLRFRHVDDRRIELATRYEIASGAIEESFILRKTPHGLQSERLTRQMTDSAGNPVRNEQVDFGADLGLAPNTYPEVLLPLMLGWPAPERTRAFYSWINDRFVSRVYVESRGETELQLNGRSTRALEMVLFPDLNDFVRVGSTMARLAKPIMPKYHLWFDPQTPNTIMRFEGPYGPPGAPELIMERVD